MADQPDSNLHPQSARTLAILDDLAAGMPPAEVARNHGATKQWVHVVRKRAGIPLPAPLPEAPKPPTPKPVKHPRPIPARTLAVLEDVRAGMLYEAVAARHGITEFYVGRLAKQHGVARSQTDPGWRTRKYGAGVRSLPMPTRPRSCGIWKRVTPMPRWPRATGARSRASPTRRTGMGFDGGVRRNSSLRGA